MGLSSNTLIHLTIKKESLFGIIKEGFRVKYCYEPLKTKNGSITAAYPVVSLSDIPLSELSYQVDSYGNYGIGLKKQWAKIKGLNPVLYFDADSNIGARIRKDFEETFTKVIDGSLDGKFHETNFELLSYSKNYEGTLKTEKRTLENYRFSDEREWRYVPSEEDRGGAQAYVAKSDYDTKEKKLAANQTLNHLRLTFEPDDINYIFVEKETEISEIIEAIRSVNSSKPYSSVERLFSRIVTTEQLRTDF